MAGVHGMPWVVMEAVLPSLLARSDELSRSGMVDDNQARVASHIAELDDIVVIPVMGCLFHYANLLTTLQGSSTYAGLQEALAKACAEPNVRGIILDIDSPGGEVSGCAALAHSIYQARNLKPIVALVSGDCASGAYWLGSACERLIVSKTSQIGSIGVVASYRDQQDKAVIDIVSTQSPHKRLDPKVDSERARLQARIDAIAQVFIEAVATHRGVTPSTVMNDFGTGDLLVGQQAVTCGLADVVGSLSDAIVHIKGHRASRQSQSMMNKEMRMTEVIEPSVTATSEVEHSQQEEEAKVDLMAKGRIEERERIAAIIASDAAKGRASLAQHLAFATDLSTEIALSTLQAAAVEVSPSVVTTGFDAVMAGIDNPTVTAAIEEPDTINQLAKRIASQGGSHHE